MDKTWEATAICPLGLETTCANEMASLGLEVDEVHLDGGLIEWRGGLEDLALAHPRLRTIERLTITVGRFHVRGFAELRRKIATLPWESWIPPGVAIATRVTSRGSRLYHETAIGERVVQGVSDRLGREITPAPRAALDDERADRTQLLVVRVEKDECVVRLDATGPRLHRRGYRLATATAPLRETLAAALLHASGYEGHAPFADPFCGSGTFPIEAAALAAGESAPWLPRNFAFERWPIASGIVSPASPEQPAVIDVPIVGADRHVAAIEASTTNATRAGFADAIDFRVGDVEDFQPPTGEPGWIVTNPPYGHRSGREGELLALHSRFGAMLRARARGWRVTLLCPRSELANAVGLDFQLGPWVNNGGLRVRVLHAWVP